jgi:hypothetical protein
MSARHSTWSTPANPEDPLLAENIQLKQLNQEMKKDWDGLEQNVKEAKILVQQTQSKVEKLAAAVDKIEEPETSS